MTGDLDDLLNDAHVEAAFTCCHSSKPLIERLIAVVIDQRNEIARHHDDFAQWEEMAAKGSTASKRVRDLELFLKAILGFSSEKSPEAFVAWVQDRIPRML